MPDVIKIEGLRELRSSLRKMDAGLPKTLRLAGNRAANVVVDEAKPRVPRLTGRAAASIRVASTQSSVRVRAGSKRVPYYPWLDFGGRVGPNRSVSRPFLKRGRFIWAAFGDKRDAVERELQDALVDVARTAGVEVQ